MSTQLIRQDQNLTFGRKVGHVLFNPAAENVIASSSGDFSVKLWDIEAGSSKLTLRHNEVIQSLSWSTNGSLLVTTSRDKKLRVWDVRQEKPAVETTGHAGAKNSRAVWMGEHDRIATTGFSRMSDRQLALWDIKAPREPVGGFQMLDSISGVCMPFWDDGTQCLYLAGKGDGNIRYYEYENDEFQYLSEYKSADPQRGVAFVPKRGVNTHENEVMRGYKTVNDAYIEPISFIVPRRADAFQDDIYPPTIGLKSAMSANEYFEGGEGVPPKISMEDLFEGKGLNEVPADQVKSPPRAAPSKIESTPAPVTTKKQEAPIVVEPPQAAVRVPPASMKEQGASMSTMVDKFADKDEMEEDEDDNSSFEEVQKPTERIATKSVPADVVEEDVGGSTPALPKHDIIEPDKPVQPPPEPELQPAPTSTSTRQGMPVPTQTTAATADATRTAPAPASSSSIEESRGSSGEVAGLERELRNLKTIMAEQTQQMAQMSSTISDLVEQIKSLKQ